MVFDPGMIEPHVIGHEVEHQSQAALAEPLAKPCQCRVSAEIRVHRVAGDGETGTGDVLLAQVRQRLLELAAPFGIASRDAPAPAPVCQTLSNQIQSKPIEARRSSSASGMSSRVAGRPELRASCVSQTRVLIW